MSFIRNSVRILVQTHNIIISRPSIQSRSIKRWVAPTLREMRRRKEKIGPQEPSPRSSHVEWNYNAEIFAFRNRLRENFDTKLLQTAFVNRSYIIQEELRQKKLGVEEPKIDMEDNQKLVKQGEKLVTEYVKAYLQFSLPKVPSEGITAFLKFLTSEETLADVSSNLGTKDLVLSSDFPPETRTLRDTLMAVIAALAESSGEERAYSFIRDFICTQMNQKDLTELWEIQNPLEMLKHVCKDIKLEEPEPRLIGESAKNTVLAAHHVGLYSSKKLIGKGYGESIEIAQETAALDALRNIFGIHENIKPFDFNLKLEKLNNESQNILQDVGK